MKVFAIERSSDDYRPQIDFEDEFNQQNNWELLGEITIPHWPGRNGVLRDVADYQPIDVIVDHPMALQWDNYRLPGLIGLFSERATEIFRQSAHRRFRFLPARLNNA